MNEAKNPLVARLRRFVLSVRWILLVGVLAMFISTSISCATGGNSARSQERKIPVIFDTDICDDIDDTWALSMLLQSPEFDVKLITTAVRNTPSKAKVVAKFLETVGRTDIPIGIGVQHNEARHRQRAWIEDYELSSYPGKIYEDGVQALIDTIMKSRKPIMNPAGRLNWLLPARCLMLPQRSSASRKSLRRRSLLACTAAFAWVMAAVKLPAPNIT